MAATGGAMVLESDVLGRFEVRGPHPRCLYFDLIAGSEPNMRVVATADDRTAGVLPEFSLVEYGPAGPHWYHILNIECHGTYGRCDRQGADAWRAAFAERRRGRQDPCGSAVVKRLTWDTSGSESTRDGGFFHDFAVSFALEIKKFETRFAPGSTECVPK